MSPDTLLRKIARGFAPHNPCQFLHLIADCPDDFDRQAAAGESVAAVQAVLGERFWGNDASAQGRGKGGSPSGCGGAQFDNNLNTRRQRFVGLEPQRVREGCLYYETTIFGWEDRRSVRLAEHPPAVIDL